jgi:hypothetical protein
MNATLTTLTVLAIAVAGVMTAIVLRLMSQERRRSAARVAALEADIYRTKDEDIEVLHDPRSPTRGALPNADAIATDPWNLRREAHPAALHDATLFPEQGRQRPFPIAPLVVAVGAALMFVFLIAASRHRTPTVATASAAQARTAQTLELLALVHERDDDHLTVRGVVRNPPRGAEVDHLTAVVLLFNQQGGFLTSARSPVESTALQPGAEASFVVTVPGVADVGRYRVSFRTDDRVVPHVDRR